MIEWIVQRLIHHPFLVISLLLLSYVIFNRYGRGIDRFKGPFIASLTSAATVWDVWYTAEERPYIHKHEKYGDVVRLSPNKLSFAQPQAIRDIYGPTGLTQKSDFHLASQQTSNGEAFQTLFATIDKTWHDNVRKCVSSGFSMTTMVQYEAYVEDTVRVFLQQMDSRFGGKAGPRGLVDFPKWLHFFTDDAITCITYGTRIGHMETGDDVSGILKAMETNLKYAMLIGQWPVIDLFFRKNPINLWLQHHDFIRPVTTATVSFAREHQQDRRRLLAEKKVTGDSGEQTLTDKFIKAAETNREVMGPREVLALGLSIIAAGSETTAISLSAVFYYILRNPNVLRQLREEIDAAMPASPSGPNTYSSIPFATAQQLPYLNACIKEAFRVHPATRWFPERVVPKGGHTICGEYIPGGTVVGVSAWVLHQNTGIFGPDVKQYRPERWLGNSEKAKEMERFLLQFGSGNYTCIGKNIGLMEMYKLVPAVLRHFEVWLDEPKKDWKFVFGSFVNVTDFNVRIKRRQKK